MTHDELDVEMLRASLPRSAWRCMLDTLTLAFLVFALATVTMLCIRFGLALFSSDRIEACAFRSNGRGYTLVQQRRWEVVPMVANFDKLDEMLKVASIVCSNLQVKQ